MTEPAPGRKLAFALLIRLLWATVVVLRASRIQAHYEGAIGDPVLLSTRMTNKLTFSWTGLGLKLQRNPGLSNAASRTDVVGGSSSQVSVTIGNSGNQFFRLKWP